MNPSYFAVLFLFLVVFMIMRTNQSIIAGKAIQKRKSGDKTQMIELAKRFIGKECLIYAFDSNHQFVGIITEVTDGAILLEKDDTLEAINLDFVIRIREYPKKKNGKKKSVVLD